MLPLKVDHAFSGRASHVCAERAKGVSRIETVVIAAIVLSCSVFVLDYVGSAPTRLRASCQGTLKQWGTIFKLYADEDKGGYLPRMQGPQPWLAAGQRLGRDCNADPIDFRFSPDLKSVVPEYLTDLRVLQCDANRDAGLRTIDDGCAYAGFPSRPDASYQYLGYVIDRAGGSDPWSNSPDVGSGAYEVPAQLIEVFLALPGLNQRVTGEVEPDYAKCADALAHAIEVVPGAGNGGGEVVHRLRLRFEQLAIANVYDPTLPALTSAQIPTLWDRLGPGKKRLIQGSHSPAGCNVLYLDGHVEWHEYRPRGPFPSNDALPAAIQWALGDRYPGR